MDIKSWHIKSNPHSVLQHSSKRATLPTQAIIGNFALASYGMAVSPFLLMSSIKYHRPPLKAVSFLLQSHTSQYTPFNAIVLVLMCGVSLV